MVHFLQNEQEQISSTAAHLPRAEGLHFEGGQAGKSSQEAEPLPLNKGYTVEEDAVRQDERDIRPAHDDQHGHEAIQHVDQRPVLWIRIKNALEKQNYLL